MDEVAVTVNVNGERRRALIEARKTLADFLREDCALTGTNFSVVMAGGGQHVDQIADFWIG